MLHRYLVNKLFVVFLILNFNCSTLYKGNDKISDEKTLYPTKNNVDLGNNALSFKLKIDKNDLNKTLFVNIKIQNPQTTTRNVEAFSEILEKKLKHKGCNKKNDLLTISVEHEQKGEITKKFIDDEVVKIQQQIVDHKYKKNFNKVIVSVIYDGCMRILAQNIIKDLTSNCSAYEICFNSNETDFTATEEVQKQIENYKNPQIKKINSSDIDEVKRNKIDDVVKEVVDEFFIKS